MAFTKEQIDELKANIALARKRELAFGLCVGKSPETTVFMNHKTKDPEALGRQAKKDGETTKIAFGTMAVEGKNLNLSCVGDVPTGIARKTKELMRLAGLKVKVRILDEAGNAIEEDGDPDEDDEDVELDGDGTLVAVAKPAESGGGAGASADPLTEKWEGAKAKVAAAFARAGETAGIVLTEAKALWDKATAAASGGDLGAALTGLPDVASALAAAAERAKLADADRARWQDALPKLTPLVAEAEATATPLAAKIAAVWSFARTKAEGNPPDFTTAVKSMTMLVKLLQDNRALVAKGPAATEDTGAPEPAMAGNTTADVAEAPKLGGVGGGSAPPPAPPAPPTGNPTGSDAAAPPPQGGDAAPEAAPASAPAAPADLKGTNPEKIKRADDTLKAIDAAIDAYMKLIPGSAEVSPPAWAAERSRIDGILVPMRANAVAADAKKLDQALTDLAKLSETIRTKSNEKAEWKKTLDLFQLRLVPLDRHAQAGAVPQVKPKIDAIKADMAKAVAKADKQDFAGATADLAPLSKRCEDTELLADNFAHYATILAQRTTVVNATMGAVTGIATVDAMLRSNEKLLVDAAADAAAGKFSDAVAKLDKIPPVADKIQLVFARKGDYDAKIAALDPKIVAIEALPAPTKALMTADIAKWKVDYAAAKFAVTNDYQKSMQLLTPLEDRITFIETSLTAGGDYLTALTAFEAQFNTFTPHAGRSGIEEFYQGMQRDLTGAKTEATRNKHSTAKALLDRTKSDWPAQTTIANDCAAYIAKRNLVRPILDGLKAKPAAANALAQAEALMATAARQTVAKDFAGALASVNEAEKRGAEAKTAADAQDALGGLKDTGALDGIAADFDRAVKVYDDMRANVAGKDTTAAFGDPLKTADATAKKAKDQKGKPKPDYAAARKELDRAIKLLEDLLPKVMAKVPYDTHLAEAKLAVTNLAPLNADNVIKSDIDKLNKRIAEAEALARKPKFDFVKAEAKLSENTAAVGDATTKAALVPTIKADKATIAAIKAAIKAAPGVAAMMPKRIARLDKALTDIDKLTKAGDLRGAAAAAADGALLQAPTNADIVTCQTIKLRVQNWYTNHLPLITGSGKEAAAAELVQTRAKLAAHEKVLKEENFDGALNMLSEVSWGVQACKRVLAESGTYEPERVKSAASIKAVAAIRNEAVEVALKAVEKKYADAVLLAKDQNFFGAEKVMRVIPGEADPLLPKARAWKPFEDARKPAEAKLKEAEAHKAAASIQPMLTRLRAKFDASVLLAKGGDPAAAKTAMTEILAATTDAIKTANSSAEFGKGVEKLDKSGPKPAIIDKAKKLLATLRAKPEAPGTKTDLDAADQALKDTEAAAGDADKATVAFDLATDALVRAEMAQAQLRMLGESVKAAKLKVGELKAHAQAAYVAGLAGRREAEVDAVQKVVTEGGDIDKATKALETAMTGIAEAKTAADDQVRYIALRATPEVEPRLEVLEKHAHRYAIKASIDTIRKKLKEAADASAAMKPGDGLKLLAEVKALGTSSLVLADMRANKPPSVADVKAILGGPGGQAELDAMIETLEPDAQRAVLRVAFEARFGCKLENYAAVDAAGKPVNLVADMGLTGTNIKRFYEIMSDLPPQDVVNNDSMRTFKNVEDGGQGSSYAGGPKEVVMREGSEVLSSAYSFGEKLEVGDVDAGCEPADTKEVSFFSWNTLHEVGHAVDDKHKFMDKNGSNVDRGGWTSYVRNVKPIADIVAGHYKYDPVYVGQYMAHNANPAIPPVPTTGANACSPEEWDKRRVEVRTWVDMASVGNNPWANNSIAAQLAIGGVVYHESYTNSWSSYALAARSKGMTGYQFRAAGEWFAELYAAFHAKKLKPAHPAYDWLSKL